MKKNIHGLNQNHALIKGQQDLLRVQPRQGVCVCVSGCLGLWFFLAHVQPHSKTQSDRGLSPGQNMKEW